MGTETQIEDGMRVKVTKLESTRGMMIAAQYLAARKKGATGTVQGYVPGHGGDVWWVRHDDGSVAAYCYTELKGVTRGN